MKDAVVLSNNSSLDFHEIRMSVIRIPEVISRVFEAQQIWDECEQTTFNLYNFLTSDNLTFLSNIRLKSLATAVVQVGLYDRYTKRYPRPKYLVGSVTGDSALKVCAGIMTFKEMILSSKAIKLKRPESPLQVAEPQLAGVTLDEVGVYEFKDVEGVIGFHSVEELKSSKMDDIVTEMVEEYRIQRVVNVGPGFEVMNVLSNKLELMDVQLMESIDMDPMLSWFWGEMHRQEPLKAVAQ